MLASKISGFRMFPNTPLFHPCQNPPTYPLYNAHKYCKMFFSGGLAQLVKQRTRRSVKYQDVSPWMTQAVAELEVFSGLKSASTPKHTRHKKSHC